MKILSELGLIKDIIKNSEESSSARPTGWFQFLSGQEGHEMLYDVSLYSLAYQTPLTALHYLSQYPLEEHEGSIGIHR